jgi:hypothetical protein
MDGTARGRWQPVLDGADAVAARGAVDDIVAAIAANGGALEHPFLSKGNAGRALFYGYLAEVWPERGFDDPATSHLEHAIDQLAERTMREGLYAGFTGIAWVTEHLLAGLGIEEADDPNRALDELLRDHLATSPWPGDYDVIGGLAGCGIYALERLPRPTAREILARVVDRLAELAVADGDAICWHRAPQLLVPQTRALSPDGFYDLGTAHGVPGVLGVLAGAVAAGVVPETAGRLLDGAWRWILDHRLPPDAPTSFAYSIHRDRPAVPARSAWCYGDPGVAAAMYAAARQVGRADWMADALAIARRAAVRPAAQCGCVDAALCHGTAGLALIYDRMWQATGDALFASAARQWFRDTLARRRPGTGIAGYQAYYPGLGAGEETGWVDDASFLTGAEGVGLALLAGISTIEPAWDRLLAISLPPAR